VEVLPSVIATFMIAELAGAADWPGTADPAPWSVTASGVQVQDVVVGTGAEVLQGATAEVNYTGMLDNGQVFDSSLDRHKTLVFRVGAHAVIRGWEDGVIGMKVGGTRRLAIPPDLGYGDRATGPIPADSELFFEISLVSVVPPRTAPSAPAVVAEGDWRKVHDLKIVDVERGHGASARADHRVCLDWIAWQDAKVTSQTWDRDRCTWARLDGEDLPPALEQGILGEKPGGVREIQEASGAIWQVSLERTGR
jgi:hypothetical protein